MNSVLLHVRIEFLQLESFRSIFFVLSADVAAGSGNVRCFLLGAGLTVPGELARVTGLSRVDAGLGNHALVKEGFAVRLSPGTYRLVERQAAAAYRERFGKIESGADRH